MIYSALINNKLAKVANEKDWKEKTLGGQFMAECKSKGWQPKTSIAEMVAAFHSLLKDYWTWDAKGKLSHGPHVAALLDGEKRAAECALAARAFASVLQAPPPYGHGIMADQIEFVIYSGPDCRLITGDEEPNLTGKQASVVKPGFVSRHPNAGLFGLKPNIYDPLTKDLAPLYSWGNHKVIKFGGKFHDVCYNDSYSELSEMAAAMIARTTETKYEEGMDLAASATEQKVFIKRHGTFAYIHSAAPGSAAKNAGADCVGPSAASVFGGTPGDTPIPLPALW